MRLNFRPRRKFSFKKLGRWLLFVLLVVIPFLLAWKGHELVNTLTTWGILTGQKAINMAVIVEKIRNTWPYSIVQQGLTVDKTVDYLNGASSNLPRLLEPITRFIANATVLTAAVIVIVIVRIIRFFKTGGNPGNFISSLKPLTPTGIFRFADIAIIGVLLFKLTSLNKGEAMGIFMKLIPVFGLGLLVYMLIAVLLKKIGSTQNREGLMKALVITLIIVIIAMFTGLLTPFELKGAFGSIVNDGKDAVKIYYYGLDTNAQHVLLLLVATIVMAIFSNFIFTKPNNQTFVMED